MGKDGPWAYRVELMANQIRELFGAIPDDLETFVLASQICQAEAKKYFVEMTRLGKWRRTGVLWWNVVDGWPQFSDSVVDYYLTKKLAYHYLRRVQRPFCIMIDEPKDWHVTVVAGNDSREDVAGEYTVRDADAGTILLEGAYSAPANENIRLGRIPVSHSDRKLFLITWSSG
ncbi:MAG: glycoside hydrolase family 2, partial [Spirochaetales bacterium]